MLNHSTKNEIKIFGVVKRKIMSDSKTSLNPIKGMNNKGFVKLVEDPGKTKQDGKTLTTTGSRAPSSSSGAVPAARGGVSVRDVFNQAKAPSAEARWRPTITANQQIYATGKE